MIINTAITAFRENVFQYMYQSGEFRIFGLSHLLGIFLFLIIVVALPILAKYKFNKSLQLQIGKWLGWLVFANYIAWVLLEIIGGSFDMKLHLPFHLCRMANLLLPIVMLYRHKYTYEILYFWGLSGMFQGLITPDITNDFPHFHYFRFWLGHNGLIIALIYATVVYGMRPSMDGIKKAFIALNVFFGVAIIANLILDANYFWICGKPPIASLLDYMGPWPWYILSGEVVALIHFGLAYLPFYILDKRNSVQESIDSTDQMEYSHG